LPILFTDRNFDQLKIIMQQSVKCNITSNKDMRVVSGFSISFVLMKNVKC